MLFIKFEGSYKGNQIMMHTITDFKKAQLNTEHSIYLPRLTNYAYVYVLRPSLNTILKSLPSLGLISVYCFP